MDENIIVNYWNLNKVYVIITAVIVAVFAIISFYLFIQFQIEISKELNSQCDNPIAIYFDKESRTQCLTKAMLKQNALANIDKEFKKDSSIINTNITNLKQKMQLVDGEFDALQKRLSEDEAQELVAVKKAFMDLSGVIVNIKTKYTENKTQLGDLFNDYEKTFNDNIQIMVGVGDSLVNKLLSNVYTKSWKNKRQALVNSYNKIKEYLNKMVELQIVKPEEINMRELSKDAQNGKTK